MRTLKANYRMRTTACINLFWPNMLWRRGLAKHYEFLQGSKNPPQDNAQWYPELRWSDTKVPGLYNPSFTSVLPHTSCKSSPFRYLSQYWLSHTITNIRKTLSSHEVTIDILMVNQKGTYWRSRGAIAAREACWASGSWVTFSIKQITGVMFFFYTGINILYQCVCSHNRCNIMVSTKLHI